MRVAVQALAAVLRRRAVAAHELVRRGARAADASARRASRCARSRCFGTKRASPPRADPLGGSYYVEALTDELEARRAELIERIDELRRGASRRSRLASSSARSRRRHSRTASGRGGRARRRRRQPVRGGRRGRRRRAAANRPGDRTATARAHGARARRARPRRLQRERSARCEGPPRARVTCSFRCVRRSVPLHRRRDLRRAPRRFRNIRRTAQMRRMRRRQAAFPRDRCGVTRSSRSWPSQPLAATVIDRAGSAPSFQRDVAPILRAKCTGCHQLGGIAPFSLETAEAGAGQSGADQRRREREDHAAVAAGARFPDYVGQEHPATHGAAEEHDPRWARAGGKAAGPGARKAPTSEPDVRPGERVHRSRACRLAYRPSAKNGATDDYRCFLLDPKLDEDAYATSARIVPGAASIVHHVILFRIDKGLRPERNAGRLVARRRLVVLRRHRRQDAREQ